MHAERLKVTFAKDEAAQDQKIDILAEQITMVRFFFCFWEVCADFVWFQLFRRCENRVKQIAVRGGEGGKQLTQEEVSVRLNVMRGMADKIRSQSKTFRNMQRDFLVKLRKRDESNNEFFSGEDEQLSGVPLEEILENGLSQEQINQMDNIRRDADLREKEIIKIAQSINELATMFRELSILIVEQGSILDRIDYNIDQAQVKVAKGKSELEIANKHSEASSKRSLICIAVLILSIIICVTILVLKLKNKN
jgi:syntaxin 16